VFYVAYALCSLGVIALAFGLVVVSLKFGFRKPWQTSRKWGTWASAVLGVIAILLLGLWLSLPKDNMSGFIPSRDRAVTLT